MADFESYPMEIDGHTVELREYGPVDWIGVRNSLRKYQATRGLDWIRFQEWSIHTLRPSYIRKHLKLKEGEVLQVAQFDDINTPYSFEIHPDQNRVNEIGVKRVRRKFDSEKNRLVEKPLTRWGWHTWLRLEPPATLSPRAQEHLDMMLRMKARAKALIEEQHNKPELTEYQKFERELEGHNIFEQNQMRKERKAARLQEWVDKRQQEREDAPKLRAKAIEVQRQRAAAGSPIKRRTK